VATTAALPTAHAAVSSRDGGEADRHAARKLSGLDPSACCPSPRMARCTDLPHRPSHRGGETSGLDDCRWSRFAPPSMPTLGAVRRQKRKVDASDSVAPSPSLVTAILAQNRCSLDRAVS
jgi:hypothetical protein